MIQQDRAKSFHALHAPGQVLLLTNAWDAASARLIAEAGAPAIATTSAGLAWACGYPDGNALPVPVLVGAVKAIARVISVPLTVDSEGGYSDDPAQVAETITALIDAGAVGINLEDGTGAPDLHVAKIEAVRAAAQQRGVDLFINARVDTVLHKLVPAEQAVTESIRRAHLYAQAGASGIFVPGLADAAQIRSVADAVAPLPLNVLTWPGLGGLDEVRAAGARRISTGAVLSRAAYAAAHRLAGEFLRTGSAADLLAQLGEMPSLNALLPRG